MSILRERNIIFVFINGYFNKGIKPIAIIYEMITSSHFFNKSIFHAHDDQIESLANEVGPWFISKSRKYATLDPEKRINNKS